MKPVRLSLSLLSLFLSCVAHSASAQSTPPSPEEMWALIQQQQAQIAELQAALRELGADVATTQTAVAANRASVTETQEQVALTADAVAESASTGSTRASWADRTRIGGYGEVHLNFRDGGASNMIDYHRYVLFVNHDFSDSIRFFSELELEHSIAGDGQPGEVELEQAYIEFDVSDQSQVKAGLFLMPVGLLNETHEPATFYGVERNKVESRIIPTTWWEAGLAYSQQLDNGFSYDLTLTSGLDNADGVLRSGRQKVGEAIAESALGLARVQYSGIPGVKLGATVGYQADIAQSVEGATDALLIEAHADIRKGPFGLRALYAQWMLDGPTIAATAEEQFGYYIEPSYRFFTDLGEFGFFVRFTHYEYQRNATAFRSDDLWETGVNYWPIEPVVLKFDYQYAKDAEELAGDHWFNFGVGYHF